MYTSVCRISIQISVYPRIRLISALFTKKWDNFQFSGGEAKGKFTSILQKILSTSVLVLPNYCKVKNGWKKTRREKKNRKKSSRSTAVRNEPNIPTSNLYHCATPCVGTWSMTTRWRSTTAWTSSRASATRTRTPPTPSRDKEVTIQRERGTHLLLDQDEQISLLGI